MIHLGLLQLGDSAIPIGGFSHSWGLEAAIDRGAVADAKTLESWCRAWLTHSVAPLEGVIVGVLTRVDRDNRPSLAAKINELLWATLTPGSIRHASRDMGEQLLGLAESWPWAREAALELRSISSVANFFGEWHHAPVWAVLAVLVVSNPEEAILVYLHQAVGGVISAAVRALPLGHSHGQQVLATLRPSIERLAQEMAHRGLDQIGSYSPHHEVLCYAQTHLYSRLFRS